MLATIKGHSKMCSFITQHNTTDDASFEGACNWYTDWRNVHQSCCPWIECSFLYHKPSPKLFPRIWQYIQPASQPKTTCNHASPGPPHPASSPPRSSETSVFQFLPISSNFAQPLKRSGPTFHNQQPDQLYVKEMCVHCMRKMVVTMVVPPIQ